MTASYPPAGLIGLAPVHGAVGNLIEFGQWLNGDGFKSWEHAFVSIGGGLIVEAQPGGARVAHADEYAEVHWCYGICDLTAPGQLSLIEEAAKRYIGTPYSALDYFALAAHRLHIPAPGLRNYVKTSKHMICSQLADQCYADGGVQIFSDGRWPGFVDPLALYNRDLELTAR